MALTPLELEQKKKETRQEIAVRREFLQVLDGMRELQSRALTAEYCWEKLLLQRKMGEAGLLTGVEWWDRFAGPFRRANVYCLAGYQGVGKTTLAAALTWPLAKRGLKVWNYCMELTATETFAVVAGHVLGKAALTEEDETRAYATIQTSGYRFFEPERDLSWEQHLAIIQKTVRAEKIDLVVIDNFSYLTSVARNSYETERVAAKALKGLAQELEIPIIVIAHLRKPDRDDSEPKPTAHSVLGSGAITQVASDVFIVHYPLVDSEDNTRQAVGYVFSGKPRWTKGGRIYLQYDGSARSFSQSSAEQFKGVALARHLNDRPMPGYTSNE
jgi:replicative DNA helicase